MLDIKLIREQPHYVRQRLATRGTGEDLKVDEVLALDERRRNLLTEVETLKAERNKISKQIGALMGQRKLEEAETMKAQTRDMGEKIAALDKAVAEIEQAREQVMLRFPNLPHPSVAVGKNAEDNPMVRTWGAQPALFQTQTTR